MKWGDVDFEKKRRPRATSVDGLAISRPSQAPSPSLIRLESRGDGDDLVSFRLASEEEEECGSRRARCTARVSEPSVSPPLND